MYVKVNIWKTIKYRDLQTETISQYGAFIEQKD